MTYFKYSVLEDGKLIANLDIKKEALSLAQTLHRMNKYSEIKVVENNEYPIIHGYQPKYIKILGTVKTGKF